MNVRSISESQQVTRIVTAVKPDRVELLFTLVLSLFMGTLLWMTVGYEGFGRIIPLIVAIPTFAFLLVILAAKMSPRVGEILTRYQARDVIDVDELEQFTEEAEGDTPSLYEQRMQFVSITVWILVFALLFHFVGIVESITLILLGYYRLSANQSVSRTLIYTAGTLVFVYLVFDMVLGMRLFDESWFAFLLP